MYGEGQCVFHFVVPGTYPLVVEIPNRASHTIPNIVVGHNQITVVNETICRDSDADGFTEEVDCNDNNENIKPGATELCDGVDNNCDGLTDEGCPGLCNDGDADGFFAQAGCGTQVDCDDSDPTIRPNAAEICDGIDNNCDGQADEGIPAQGCGVGACSGGTQTCENGVFGQCSSDGQASAEICGDGIDNNCDGQTDEGFDLSSDPNNCGGCGIVCQQGEACQNSQCAAVCGNGVVDAGEDCDGGTCCSGSCTFLAQGTVADCSPFVCSGFGFCNFTCTSNDDCAPTFTCDTTADVQCRP